MNPRVLYYIKSIIVISLLAWYATFLSHKINLTTADLGRHIQNGNIIINGSREEKTALLHSNFYSYTLPAQAFINHHWGSGVVFYFINQFFGFTGLSFFYILLGIATLVLFWDIARKESNFFIASGFAFALIPLLTSRAEVRPEMFTYFLTAVFFWILWEIRAAQISDKYLYSLPILMLLWVNLHIGFIFGFLVLGAFGLEQLTKLVKKQPNHFLQLFYISLSCALAGLINPNFINGLLAPLNIFKNYGYLIVENQSISFLENLNFTANQHFLLFKATVFLILASFIIIAVKNWRKIDLAQLILVSTTGLIAYFGIRNFPSFAFFTLPALSKNIYDLRFKNTQHSYNYYMWTTGVIILAILLLQQFQTFQENKSILGFGLLPGVNASAEFYKTNKISGPLFNNYDIGGYLIYHLYPQKLFVDNRPEAYTADFFENRYKSPQENPKKWAELEKKYHFNSIFFAYHDYTPWAQTFLVKKIKDPDWAPVFVDQYAIIFLKRNKQNKNLISKYEIPKSKFSTINQ
ncbi:MAG TPA: hypothetical protein VLG67_02435 [Candidatus Saccharimonadales bacterium]|nr:hypothetical protein [Candidatus Saccharimonadales bacterium]